MSAFLPNVRPKPDKVLTLTADYATKFDIKSRPAYETARYCLMDTLGCGLEALEYPACTKLLGPIVPGPIVPNGAKVPGTRYQLDPVQAAFNTQNLLPGARAVQGNSHFLEIELENPHGDPWAQRPRRVVLVADDEQRTRHAASLTV